MNIAQVEIQNWQKESVDINDKISSLGKNPVIGKTLAQRANMFRFESGHN